VIKTAAEVLRCIGHHDHDVVFQAGFKNLRLFAYIADTEAGAREVFRGDDGVNPVESPGMRMLTADRVARWHDAQKQCSKEPDSRAAKRAGEPVCFKFNNSVKRDDSCGRAHVCQKCFRNDGKGACRGEGGK
jgi:hypothetical protein